MDGDQNTQQDPNNQDSFQIDQQNSNSQSVSSKFQHTPTVGEINPFGMNTEVVKEPEASVENISSLIPENLKSVETENQPEEETIESLHDETPINNQSDQTQTTPKNIIVDKSDEPVHLHEIATNDPLTKRADEEEQEFIEKVEQIHGSNN